MSWLKVLAAGLVRGLGHGGDAHAIGFTCCAAFCEFAAVIVVVYQRPRPTTRPAAMTKDHRQRKLIITDKYKESALFSGNRSWVYRYVL